MSTPMNQDPEMDFAELCLDAADLAESCFEQWWRMSEEAPTPRLRALWARAAAEELAFANEARAWADDLLWDYD